MENVSLKLIKLDDYQEVDSTLTRVGYVIAMCTMDYETN